MHRLVRQGRLKAHRQGKCGLRIYLNSITAYQADRAIGGENDRRHRRRERNRWGRRMSRRWPI